MVRRRPLQGGGLLVLSRRPIDDVRFQRFTLSGQPERIAQGEYHAGKGFASIGLTTEAGPLTLIDTHLHARYGSDVPHEYRSLRAAQVVELALHVRATPGAVAALGGVRVERMTRRRLLRQALRSAGVAAVVPAVGFSVVSELFVPDEFAGFDAVSRRLAQLALEPAGEAAARRTGRSIATRRGRRGA